MKSAEADDRLWAPPAPTQGARFGAGDGQVLRGIELQRIRGEQECSGIPDNATRGGDFSEGRASTSRATRQANPPPRRGRRCRRCGPGVSEPAAKGRPPSRTPLRPVPYRAKNGRKGGSSESVAPDPAQFRHGFAQSGGVDLRRARSRAAPSREIALAAGYPIVVERQAVAGIRSRDQDAVVLHEDDRRGCAVLLAGTLRRPY